MAVVSLPSIVNIGVPLLSAAIKALLSKKGDILACGGSSYTGCGSDDSWPVISS